MWAAVHQNQFVVVADGIELAVVRWSWQSHSLAGYFPAGAAVAAEAEVEAVCLALANPEASCLVAPAAVCSAAVGPDSRHHVAVVAVGFAIAGFAGHLSLSYSLVDSVRFAEEQFGVEPQVFVAVAVSIAADCFAAKPGDSAANQFACWMIAAAAKEGLSLGAEIAPRLVVAGIGVDGWQAVGNLEWTQVNRDGSTYSPPRSAAEVAASVKVAAVVAAVNSTFPAAEMAQETVVVL